MRELLSLTLLSLLLSPATVYAEWRCQGQQNTANCPPCYYNQTLRIPTKGGILGDGTNRHVVNVFVKNAPNSGWTQAIDAGLGKWNNATDTTSQPGVTKRPPYAFDMVESESEADVVIEFTPDVDSAQYRSGNPAQILFNPNAPVWGGGASHNHIAGTMGHELGHDRGLGNAYKVESGCGQADTIMRGISHLNVHDRDVFQMNKAFQNPNQCCANASVDPGTNGNDCFDMDGDGFTTCNGDCDDNNPNSNTNCTPPCQPTGEETLTQVGQCGVLTPPECEDYADNDCDGQIDYDDPGCHCTTPVVVDPAGDGFDLSGLAGGARFDFAGNGHPYRLAWIQGDDAWLALDRDGNGRIDDGSELFGNLTPQLTPPGEPRNGFRALAEYDKTDNGGNGDGTVDASDAVYTSLRLWQDHNHDGVSQAEELYQLPSLGIESISLDYRESRKRDRHGNEFRYRAKVNGRGASEAGKWAYDVIPVKEE